MASASSRIGCRRRELAGASAVRARLAVCLGLFLVASCGSKPAAKKPAAPSKPADVPTLTVDAGRSDPADAGLAAKGVDEAELTESDKSRDPFRSYAAMFSDEARKAIHSQREVLLDQYSLDELKLIGIVRGPEVAVAMLTDPTGKGHVVRRGQFVGRAEVVQGVGQGSTAYEINWRVDSIRDGDVIFIREDPRNRDVPSATKVIPLRPEGSVPEHEK